MKFCWLYLVVALAACKSPNPAKCCTSPEDCAANLGVDDEERSCSAGLACVDNNCVVPSCSLDGCGATAPICDITSDVCIGCDDSADCSRFPDQSVCDTTTGVCVECTTAAECDVMTPVCDASACRGCEIDSECPSGACGEDGACVPESSIVYLDPGGIDSGTCPRSAPCRTIGYATAQTITTRNHIVMLKGGYSIDSGLIIDSQSTSISNLVLHGGGSSLTQSVGEGAMMRVLIPITIRDLEMQSGSGGGVTLTIGSTSGASLLERVTARSSGTAIGLGSGSTTIRDVVIEGTPGFTGIAASTGATLTVERVAISGFTYGVKVDVVNDPLLMISNLLVYDCSTLALDLELARGSIEFSTIADSGMESGNGPRAVACSSNMTIRSSIVWAPGTTPRAPIEGCNLISTIAGPTAVPGANSSDPLFVNNSTRDYHLRPGSPARDQVDSGPATDLEGTPRPLGARFDLGTYEATP